MSGLREMWERVLVFIVRCHFGKWRACSLCSAEIEAAYGFTPLDLHWVPDYEKNPFPMNQAREDPAAMRGMTEGWRTTTRTMTKMIQDGKLQGKQAAQRKQFGKRKRNQDEFCVSQSSSGPHRPRPANPHPLVSKRTQTSTLLT